MTTNELNPRHLRFAELIADGATATEAYRKIYPEASDNSSRSNASKLLKSHLIAGKIEEYKNSLKRVVEAQIDKFAKEITPDMICGKLERMAILSRIARGDLKVRRKFVVSTGAYSGSEVQEHETEPDFAERTKAIAELNKMDGSYEPYKAEINISDNAGKDILYVEFVEVKEVCSTVLE